MALWVLAAALPAVFGIQLGAPIDLPECHVIPNASVKAYAGEQPTTCWESPVVLQGDALPSTPIDFPTASAPLIVKNGRIYALVIGGKAEGIMFLTPGADAQSAVMAELRKKFGEPSSLASNTVDNAMGASFKAIDARWSVSGADIRYQGIAERIDAGRVTIETGKAKAARAAGDKAEDAQRTPM